ncbi:MAG: AraC family transcriptional regulator, partial [Planctomycetes bacterium]|nr:AraC family transcriptional regulator [Planctomycetota bacterium]
MAELTGDDPLHIRVISAGITSIDHTWNYQDVRSPYWRFYVNSRDGASAVVAGRRHPLSAGRIHLLPAWMIFTCHNTAPIVHLHARFEVLGLAASLVRDLFPLPISLGIEPELERGARHAARVLSSADAVGPDDRLEIKALIHRALGRAFAQLPADRRSALGRMLGSAGPLAAAIQAIHGRIDQTHANEELARACGMSEDHFIKVFRTTIGQTPAQ